MRFARHLILVTGLLGIALGASAAPDTSAVRGKKLLFVIQEKAAADVAATDAKAKEHLESLGFSVETADQADAASRANAKDVIVISSSVSANKLEGKYRSVPVPVVTWEAFILPHMGMSGKKEDVEHGTHEGKHRYLWLVNAPHPLSGGLAPGMVNVYQKGASMNWGTPGLGATIIATVPGEPAKAPIFAYEKGATMDQENIAPARRVQIFLDNTTFTNLNEAGLKLFDAAVIWAAGQPAK